MFLLFFLELVSLLKNKVVYVEEKIKGRQERKKTGSVEEKEVN